ncbi:MAG: hypothetical protein JSS02_10255 [Planctomycetes bacterium]|nr:hypothetical protein [Planctomycetota bacterium]
MDIAVTPPTTAGADLLPAQFPAVGPDQGWRVVHEIPGRIRLKNRALCRRRDLCALVERELQAVWGIVQCQVSSLTGSVLVKYAVQKLRRDQVVEIVESLSFSSALPARSTAGSPAGSPDGRVAAPASESVALPLCAVAVPLAAAAQIAVPILLPLSAGLLAYTAWPSLKRAFRVAVDERRVGGDAVDSILVGGCLVTGAVLPGSIMCLCLEFGRTASRRARERARQVVLGQLAKIPRYARVCYDDQVVDTLVQRVRPGDFVEVRAGEIVPLDGIVAQGAGQFDHSAWAGPGPVRERGPGERVFAGAVVVSGTVRIRVEATGTRTAVAGWNELLAHSTDEEPLAQRFCENWADRTALPILALAATALVTVGPAGALAIMYCDFRTGVRMSAPPAVAVAIARGANYGILVKAGPTLERLARVDTFVLDLTAFPEYRPSQLAAVVTGLKDRGVSRCLLLTRLGDPVDLEWLDRIGAEHVPVRGGEREKAEIVFDLQEFGDSVCFVGQGVENRAAMRTAAISLSFSHPAEVVDDPAQILILGDDLDALVRLRELAGELNRNLQRTWQWTLAPNVICILGAFTLGFGVAAAMTLNAAGSFVALANGLWPLRRLAEDRLQRDVLEDLRDLYHNSGEVAVPASVTGPGPSATILQMDKYRRPAGEEVHDNNGHELCANTGEE